MGHVSPPLYWIPLLPLLGAALNLLVGRKLPRWVVHLIACGSVFLAMLVALKGVFFYLYPEWKALTEAAGEGALAAAPRFVESAFDWIVAGSVKLDLGLVLDPVSAVMLIIVTFVGFLIHLYSTGYMAEEPDYARYFAYLNLFTGAMLLLVLGDNLVVLFIGWEGVGVCSYLLIGFWYDKSGTARFGDENATAGKKAFIVNRIGDFAFIVGMLLLFFEAGTLNIAGLAEKTDALTRTWAPWWGWGDFSVAGVAALLLFIGACGKSAQIPLYVWLPDAMAGPTPVSALIHAATMVTAGVYMVVRLNFLYMLSPPVMALVAFVGALTAFFAATIGFAQNDIKKVLAYSTVSQLGYMFLGAGVGAFAPALFHVFTHAFFKACLFLGSGAVIHALLGEQDIRRMGGLKKHLPITRWTFLLSTIAIAGIPFWSGFFSKDEILWQVFISTNNPEAWWSWVPKATYIMAFAGAICTAFYMFRLYYLTFEGDCRVEESTLRKLHPPGPAMAVPLVVLAFGATVLGLLGVPPLIGHYVHLPNVFHHWLAPVVEQGQHLVTTTQAAFLADRGLQAVGVDHAAAANHGLELALMLASVAAAAVGLLVARYYYSTGLRPEIRKLVASISGLHHLVYNKYFVDEIYGKLIVGPFKWLAKYIHLVADRVVIDILAVNGAAKVVDLVGKVPRWVQNGNLQHYVAVLVVGLVFVIYWVSEPPDDFKVEPAGKVTMGQQVTFDASRPGALDGRQLEYRWDFDGDGEWDFPPATEATRFSAAAVATHRYDRAGKYNVVLEVRDLRWGTVASESRSLEVVAAGQGGLPLRLLPEGQTDFKLSVKLDRPGHRGGR